MKKIQYICLALVSFLAIFFAFSSVNSGAYAEIRSSSSFTMESDAITGGGTPAASSNYKMENDTIIEPFQTGSMESSNYKVYGEFQETLGTSPDAPTALMQYRQNGITFIATGEWVGSNTVVFKFNMTDPDPSNYLMPQLEYQSTLAAFTNKPSTSGAEVPYAGGSVTGVVTVTGLSSDIGYHWQARVIDDEYRYSSWVSFGNNAESAIDFGIDTTPPSVIVRQPNGGETLASGSVYNITWEASDPGSGIAFISIYYSTNEGLSWIFVSTNEANDGIYQWTVPNTPTTEALVKIFAYNNLGNAGWDTSDFDFRIVGPMYPPSLVTGEALPSLTPNYVRLYWNASTSESYSGYYVYRGITLGAYDPSPISGLVVGNTYDDATVVPNSGINYYYAVVTFGNGAYSPYSNTANAPQMSISREAVVNAPIAGGYTGGAHDSVPGATIRYTLRYKNIGFGWAQQVVINDKIPNYTNYKTGSATGEAVKAVRFSNGTNWTWTPTGIIDPAVTNISWEVQDVGANVSKLCTYEVIIR